MTFSETDLGRIYLREILPRVQKPARYIGGEWNQFTKDPSRAACRMVLAFPDVYEIGVSYLGYKILYELFNRPEHVYCERVYSPWPDLEALLREKNLPLVSLETFTPLHRFHLLGITLQHELSYSNVLTLLDLGGVPVTAAARGEQHPLVIAGGPGAANPEPLAEAIDLAVLGDGEEVGLALLELYPQVAALPRAERIRKLSELPGVYAPGRYRPIYSAAGTLQGISAEPGAALPVRRQVAPLPAAPLRPLVPFLAATHDRITAELFRGCTHGCRFCQAGMITRPVREKDADGVVEQVMAELDATGYEEVSLISLSSGDYTQILPVIRRLMDLLASRRVALSFPSLRLDTFRRELAETVRSVRKTGMTFAPEAASARLRQVINKGLEERGLTENISQVFGEGWDLVKLYFMIGLPSETEEDTAEIPQLVRKILSGARQAGNSAPKAGAARRAPRLHLGINLFVPKPHTPFQWDAQLPRTTAQDRLLGISASLPRGVDYRFGSKDVMELNRAYLEAVFARGDRRLWPVLKRAWELGARFDSWTEGFKFELWTRAFAEAGIDPDAYALRERAEDEVLPWDHLEMGVSKAYLLSERRRSRAGQITPDCRPPAGCQTCGMQETRECPEPPARALEKPQRPAAPVRTPEREAVRLRLRYQKFGRVRFVGHLDLVNALRRAVRRAGLPLHYSLGFHPQPALSFGPPLPLGYVGLGEWLDVGLDAWRDPREVVGQLNTCLPEGLKVEAAREIPLNAPSLSESINAGEYRLDLPLGAEGLRTKFEPRVQALLQAEETKARQWSKHGEAEVNLRPCIIKLEWLPGPDPASLRLVHEALLSGGAKPPTIVEHLCEGLIDSWQVEVTRSASGRLQNGQIIIP